MTLCQLYYSLQLLQFTLVLVKFPTKHIYMSETHRMETAISTIHGTHNCLGAVKQKKQLHRVLSHCRPKNGYFYQRFLNKYFTLNK